MTQEIPIEGPEVLGPETSGGSPGEQLIASGATLMRVEHESMMAVSVQRPRNKKKILADALDELELAPALAERNYYVIPYKNPDGTTSNVEGPGIKAARSLARMWGNCSCKAAYAGEDAERVHMIGIFIDLETNVRFERALSVSKYLKKRDGSRYHLRDAKLVQAIQAGASKAVRNAILDGLPDWLVHSYYEKSRSIAGNQAQKHVGKMLDAFLQFGVTRETLEGYIGVPLERMDAEQLGTLRGIYNALTEHQTTAEEVFAPKSAAPTDTSGVDEILGGGAETTAGTQAPAAAPPDTPTPPPADEPPDPIASSAGASPFIGTGAFIPPAMIGRLRAKATRRAIKLGLEDEDARDTILSQALGIEIDRVTEDRFDEAAAAVEDYEIP